MKNNGQGSIVFLDDSQDLRELVTLFFETKLGVRCLSFGSLMEFEGHSEQVLRARVAILDINLGPNVPDGIDAYHWLKDHGFQGKVLFLTGHARSSPQVALAATNGAEILEKPLQPERLIRLVKSALRETP
jgi:FixJ family two-component response regulator